jgi:hypothetical protein
VSSQPHAGPGAGAGRCNQSSLIEVDRLDHGPTTVQYGDPIVLSGTGLLGTGHSPFRVGRR